MSLLALMDFVSDFLPRVAACLASAWIAGFAALHDLIPAETDPSERPPPFI